MHKRLELDEVNLMSQTNPTIFLGAPGHHEFDNGGTSSNERAKKVEKVPKTIGHGVKEYAIQSK